MACPHCEQSLILEKDSDAGGSGAAWERITASELHTAVAGTVPRQRISIFYQFGLCLVAFFMVLLPVAYLGLVVAVAFGVYWYAFNGGVLFSGKLGELGGVYGIFLRVLVYIGPLLGGLIAIFFMLKPFLVRPRKPAEPMELKPDQHPFLYEFIAQVSRVLQVPIPGRIYLDCELGARVGFRRGFASFLGRDMVLWLGLPLVAGMNTRQLAGIVAHELGHCTQAMAMRLGYIIHRVDEWFMLAIYGRDKWDESFEEWTRAADAWWEEAVLLTARAAVWLSRAVLSVFLRLGHAASCFLSRQMEYHADACSFEVAGSACAESAFLRLRELRVLESIAFEGLNQIWQKHRRLPESLPDFLAELEKRMPEGFQEEARLTLLNEKAGWFATHPTAAQRIQKARQRSAEGVFQMEKPARWLFNDFEGAAKKITAIHYRRMLRLRVGDLMLRPAREFFSDAQNGGKNG